MASSVIRLAAGPLHFGLKKGQNCKSFPVAISTDGKTYRLEKKQKKERKEEESDSDFEEPFSDYRLRCVECRSFMSDLGRVNHSQICRKDIVENQRQYVTQWVAYKVAFDGSLLTEESWGEVLGAAGLKVATSESEYEHLNEFLKKAKKYGSSWSKKLKGKLEIMEELVDSLNSTAEQMAAAQKKFRFQIGYQAAGKVERLLALAKAQKQARLDFEARISLRRSNYLQKLEKEEEVFMASHTQELNSIVEKLEKLRKDRGGKNCEVVVHSKRRQGRVIKPAQKRPRLLLAAVAKKGKGPTRTSGESSDMLAKKAPVKGKSVKKTSVKKIRESIVEEPTTSIIEKTEKSSKKSKTKTMLLTRYGKIYDTTSSEDEEDRAKSPVEAVEREVMVDPVPISVSGGAIVSGPEESTEASFGLDQVVLSKILPQGILHVFCIRCIYMLYFSLLVPDDAFNVDEYELRGQDSEKEEPKQKEPMKGAAEVEAPQQSTSTVAHEERGLPINEMPVTEGPVLKTSAAETPVEEASVLELLSTEAPTKEAPAKEPAVREFGAIGSVSEESTEASFGLYQVILSKILPQGILHVFCIRCIYMLYFGLLVPDDTFNFDECELRGQNSEEKEPKQKEPIKGAAEVEAPQQSASTVAHEERGPSNNETPVTEGPVLETSAAETPVEEASTLELLSTEAPAKEEPAKEPAVREFGEETAEGAVEQGALNQGTSQVAHDDGGRKELGNTGQKRSRSQRKSGSKKRRFHVSTSQKRIQTQKKKNSKKRRKM